MDAALQHIPRDQPHYPQLATRTRAVNGEQSVSTALIYQIRIWIKTGAKIGREALEQGLAATEVALKNVTVPVFDPANQDQHTANHFHRAAVALGCGFEMKHLQGLDSELKSLMYRQLTLASIALAEAMLQLSYAAANVVWKLDGGSRPEIRIDEQQLAEWRTTCVGAAAVVQIIKTLEMIGTFDVFFPTVEEDGKGKIDLIARGKGKDFGFLIQIKSRRGQRTSCEVVRKDSERSRGDELSKFLKGVKKFSRRVGGFWIPVYLVINSDLLNKDRGILFVASAIVEMVRGE
ncbi:hypothetical protein HOI83_01045 [Candidatus Uhrbacteria bacterium]|nr:hypothetical protein [Candidatus Uhrbacteria bacterium]